MSSDDYSSDDFWITFKLHFFEVFSCPLHPPGGCGGVGPPPKQMRMMMVRRGCTVLMFHGNVIVCFSSPDLDMVSFVSFIIKRVW